MKEKLDDRLDMRISSTLKEGLKKAAEKEVRRFHDYVRKVLSEDVKQKDNGK